MVDDGCRPSGMISLEHLLPGKACCRTEKKVAGKAIDSSGSWEGYRLE